MQLPLPNSAGIDKAVYEELMKIYKALREISAKLDLIGSQVEILQNEEP